MWFKMGLSFKYFVGWKHRFFQVFLWREYKQSPRLADKQIIVTSEKLSVIRKHELDEFAEATGVGVYHGAGVAERFQQWVYLQS